MRTVDDRVMGGVSRSRVEEADDGFLYTGTLSRDRGGGFVSMRITDPSLDLTGAEGIELVVRGDGRTYQLTAQRSDVRLRAGSYRTRFEATDTWTTVRLPFAQFGAMQMGQDVAGAPSLDSRLDKVDQLGLLLTDGDVGDFRVEVRSIRTYGTERAPHGDPATVMEVLSGAIGTGVPLYNAGDAQGCTAAYEEALTWASQHPGLTEGEQHLARRALADAEGLEPQQAAWRLRAGIDALVSSTTPRWRQNPHE